MSSPIWEARREGKRYKQWLKLHKYFMSRRPRFMLVIKQDMNPDLVEKFKEEWAKQMAKDQWRTPIVQSADDAQFEITPIQPRGFGSLHQRKL